MRCNYFEAGQCRSCTLLELPYPAQVAQKVAAVSALLDHEALSWLPPVTSRPDRFRNKAKLVVGGSVAAPLLGIQRPDGVQDLSACPLHEEPIEAALPHLKDFIRVASLTPYDLASRTGELKYVLVTASPDGALMVRFVLRSREAELRLRKHLPSLLAALPRIELVSANIHPEHAAVLEGPTEIVLHGETLTMTVNDLPLHLRPRSFFQTNTAVAASLYRQATTWISDLAPSTAWDLYCGVGGFALHAASSVPGLKVLGVEVSAEAVLSAERSAHELGLEGATFRADDAGALALGHPDQAPDVVIVNPPRRGIGVELASWLQSSRASHIVYSSCNATSLAKDLTSMPSLRPVTAQLLDMFPNTGHYEVLTLLERR